ncbi:RNA polymerase sigma factor [Pseudothauera rhizosphaerae]|uniref:RNA polymerase subunit sigma-24 n=1 Tax=Pseudothauera rhizosphaerae TaxID=2565932 RepID=A0A4S4AP43_9RHOO|nr:DUF6596 domain-containing protein [Pseudothauera rhizosphaerae]THF60189.1 RNA polymerase subunit sigma-24 [Pseudothauera rhizosphaerae]
MGEYTAGPLQAAIEGICRAEARWVKATLIRLLGDFDLAEAALREAFLAAARQWPCDGLPSSPRAWLVCAGRSRALGRLRERAHLEPALAKLARHIETGAREPEVDADAEFPAEDRLRLIFLCCHPALPAQARVALTLREACGLSTAEVAAAFLTPASTMAQRIARARKRIRALGLPYELPPPGELAGRLELVLQVIHQMFDAGCLASAATAPASADLAIEAIGLGRELAELLPEAEVRGLLALMLLTEAHRPARTTPQGEAVPLAEQDRSRWDALLIAEACVLVDEALGSRGCGRYTLQAAIVAVHAEAACAADTDWAQIVDLYDALLRLAPSPVVELNRAVAVAMRDGSGAGLALLDALLGHGEAGAYGPAQAAQAELCRRLGRIEEACAAYRRALDLSRHAAERRFLARRLQALESAGPVND